MQQIKQLALIKLGNNFYDLTNNQTKEAIFIEHLLPSIIESELLSQPWHFARKIKTFNLQKNEQDEYFIDLPQDYLLLRNIILENNLSLKNYKILGSYLFIYDNLPENTNIEIEYTAKITNFNLFPALFKEVITNRLALELCEPLSQSSRIRTNIWREYKESLVKARRHYQMQIKPANFGYSSWVNLYSLLFVVCCLS